MAAQEPDPKPEDAGKAIDSKDDFGHRNLSDQMPPSSNHEKSVNLISKILQWVREKRSAVSLFLKPAFVRAGLFTFLIVVISSALLERYTRKNPAPSFFGTLISSTPTSSPPEETVLPSVCEETEVEQNGDSPQMLHLAGSSVPTQIPEVPSIAIVLTELGLMPSLTEKILHLPPPLTLALLPYEAGLQKTIDALVERQHEVLLMIPMEPLFYPEDDPGPRTLLSGLSARENIERLRSHLKGLTGYKGLMNYMGSRFTVSERDYEPILQEMRSLCEYFFDGNSAPKCLTEELAEKVRLPYASTKISLDHSLSSEAARKSLKTLEETAIKNGYAIAYSKAYSFILEELAAWLPTLSEKNIRLVPLSELLTRPASREGSEKNEMDLQPRKEF